MNRLALIALILLLAACQTNGGGGDSADFVNNDPPVLSSPIQWDRSPSNIVFRAQVVGGEYESAFFSRNDVPYCTVYGDNRIVWTVPTSGAVQQVLYDKISDQQVAAFIGTLTVDERIYTYDAKADLQLPSDVSPVVETLTINVNGQVHNTDAFGGWPDGYFQGILEKCRAVSVGPVEYRPDAAWVSAQPADFASGVPSIQWDGEAAGLSLKELAESGERKWVADRNVAILWQVLRNNSLDMMFIENGETYQVAVEAPNVNTSAPAAPSS